MHCTNGTIDNLTPDEDGCFEQVRTVLGYLPVVECTDDVNRADLSLRSLIPRRKVRIYNPYTVIENVVNSGALDALDALGSQKLMKMIKFCDVFNLPIVQFVDVAGYAIGTVAKRTATMKWGVELAKAYHSTTTLIFVITRRVYGVAGGVMLDSRDPIMGIA